MPFLPWIALVCSLIGLICGLRLLWLGNDWGLPLIVLNAVLIIINLTVLLEK